MNNAYKAQHYEYPNTTTTTVSYSPKNDNVSSSSSHPKNSGYQVSFTEPGYTSDPNTAEPIVVNGDFETAYEKKMRRRRRRRMRVAAGASAGLILGIIVFSGPIGPILAAVGGGVTARVMSKRGERKKDLRAAVAGQMQTSENLTPVTVH